MFDQYGAEAGAPLSAHEGVDKVAFTGSVATGARVMQVLVLNTKPGLLSTLNPDCPTLNSGF